MIFASIYNTHFFSGSPTALPSSQLPSYWSFLPHKPAFCHAVPLPWPCFQPLLSVKNSSSHPKQPSTFLSAHICELAPRPHIERKNVWYLSAGVWLILVKPSFPYSIWRPGQTQVYCRNTAESGSIPCPNILTIAIAQSTKLFYSNPQPMAYLNFKYATSQWHYDMWGSCPPFINVLNWLSSTSS